MFEALKIQYRMARMTIDSYMNKFESDTRGETPVRALFMLLILAVFAGAVVPTSVQSVKSGNTTGFTTSELALYALISIIIILSVVMLFARIAME